MYDKPWIRPSYSAPFERGLDGSSRGRLEPDSHVPCSDETSASVCLRSCSDEGALSAEAAAVFVSKRFGEDRTQFPDRSVTRTSLLAGAYYLDVLKVCTTAGVIDSAVFLSQTTVLVSRKSGTPWLKRPNSIHPTSSSLKSLTPEYRRRTLPEATAQCDLASACLCNHGSGGGSVVPRGHRRCPSGDELARRPGGGGALCAFHVG